jgi:lipopolysaccharide/colanic/teichoic acid biosynthesis glycosyltransferase
VAPRWNGAPKRLFDLAFSTILLVLLSPVLALCALAVRLIDGPPVLFSQERLGRGGSRFRIYKFRSMREAPGPALTAAGDPRVTPLGRQLRRAKADELPQLWNVLLGHMSLVGPRPELPEYAARYPHAFRAIADLRPGLTDWASLAMREEEEILALRRDDPTYYGRAVLPRKLAFARLYHRHMSPWIDLRLLVATAFLGVGLARVSHELADATLLDRGRRDLIPDREPSDD